MLHPTLKQANDLIVRTTGRIHLLSHLAWHPDVRHQFLASWEQGQPQMPQVTYPAIDLSEEIRALDDAAALGETTGCNVGRFLGDTARSYADVAQLLMVAGNREAGELSAQIYGKPGSAIPGSASTNIDAAKFFMRVSQEYSSDHILKEDAYCISAEVVAEELRTRIASVLTDDSVAVHVDPDLVPKAAAGANRIRIRSGTSFTEYDVGQLLQHEAFVHSLTAINGRRQPSLTALSLGAPRTTAAQEGLATFAELVTGAIDITRMARIAMRVEAIDKALSGADFITVFRSFIDSGQTDIESFNSSMRVFRGVPLTGGYAFTKDVVYMVGLLETHTFFRWALTQKKLHLCERLFAGRMKISDVLDLEEAFDSGDIAGPHYLPPWMTSTNGLTAYLAFSVFADEIMVKDVTRESFSI